MKLEPLNAVVDRSFPGYDFTVTRARLRRTYNLLETTDEEVLNVKAKTLRWKIDLSVKNKEGEELCKVKPLNSRDSNKRYGVVDAETDETKAIYVGESRYPFWLWRVLDTQENTVGRLERSSNSNKLLRYISLYNTIHADRYDFYGPGDEVEGKIENRSGLKDRYEVSLDRESEVPPLYVALCLILNNAVEARQKQ
ncbi:MAG: hypothetical protein ABEK59_10790 [Halobacteria archaeon]